jgi:hypothetical protein
MLLTLCITVASLISMTIDDLCGNGGCARAGLKIDKAGLTAGDLTSYRRQNPSNQADLNNLAVRSCLTVATMVAPVISGNL